MTILTLGIFNTIKHAQPIGMSGRMRALYNDPLIVYADQLNVLLSRSDCFTHTTGKILSKSYKVVRFLLRLNGELVFAAEGLPSGHIPAHYQMANVNLFESARCISAGNAFFDKYNKLCMINHKSGDFRPSFDSLQFALKAFLKLHVPMNKKITVMRLNSGGGDKQDYSINAEDIERTLDTVPMVASSELPGSSIQAISYQNKLEACGLPGSTIMQQIKRLKNGVISHNPYWMNSSKKLKAIINALDKLPPHLDEAQLTVIIKDPRTELYKALNIRRLSPITFFGRLGWNNAKSLQLVHDVLVNSPT